MKETRHKGLINWIRALNADPDFRVKDLVNGKLPFLGIVQKVRIMNWAKNLTSRKRLFKGLSHIFAKIFYTLKEVGIPVSPTAFLTLQKALYNGMVAGLDDFYTCARAILVKSERYF